MLQTQDCTVDVDSVDQREENEKQKGYWFRFVRSVTGYWCLKI